MTTNEEDNIDGNASILSPFFIEISRKLMGLIIDVNALGWYNRNTILK